MSGSLNAAPAEFSGHLVERAMRGGADAAQVTATRSNYFEIDFNERGIDLLRSITNSSASITIFRDGKLGSASVNGCNADDIEAALAAAQTAADAGIKDPANGIADAPILPKGEYGHKEPQRDAMIASAEGFIEELSQRYPAIRTRNSIYSFSDFERSFANSLGVRQSERRGRYGFGAGFCGKDGRRKTSFNYSGAASFEPNASLALELFSGSSTRRPDPSNAGRFLRSLLAMSSLLRTASGRSWEASRTHCPDQPCLRARRPTRDGKASRSPARNSAFSIVRDRPNSQAAPISMGSASQRRISTS